MKLDELTGRMCWPVYYCDECVKERDKTEVDIVSRLMRAGLYGKNLQHTFANFESSSQRLVHAKERAKAYAKAQSGNLWLYGGCGSGKSHLGSAIVRSAIESERRALFAEVPRLLDQLTADYLSDDSPILRESRWATCDLLILDDLGMQKCTEHRVERLTMVVNERSLHNRSTVVTSNSTASELGESLPDRLLSRLMEDCEVICTGSEDWRISKRP